MSTSQSDGRERLYLGLAILGFALAGGYTIWQSVLTRNILFWTDPSRTTAELLANGTSTAFAIDLGLVVLVAFIWMGHEARRVGIPGVWRFWVAALLFGGWRDRCRSSSIFGSGRSGKQDPSPPSPPLAPAIP